MNYRERRSPLAFDEQRSLEELQNLKREIQRARSDRERAEAEFDAFLRGFHEEPARREPERRLAPPPKPPVEEPPPSPRVEQPQPPRIEPPQQPPPATRIEQPEPPRVEQPQRPQPPAAPPRPRVEQPPHPQPPATPARPGPEPSRKPEQRGVEAAPPLLPGALDPASPLPPPAPEPFESAQGRAVDSAQGRPFDSADDRPFVFAQGRPVAAPPAAVEPQPPPPAFQAAAFDTDPDSLPPPVIADVPPLLVRPQRRQNIAAWVTIPIVLIVLAALVVMFRGDDIDPASQVTPAPATTAPETPPADAPAQNPAASSPAQTAPQPGVNLEMMTTRPVWVRVTVDGRREIERELPPGQRIPLHGERSILIRAGDAGAVTITRDGRNLGPLGEDAMPATREFKNTAPPANRQ